MIQIQPSKQAHIHDVNNRHPRSPVRDSPPTLHMACMVRPFIQIYVPIYNGISPCSTFAHQKLTTLTTNISHTRVRSSHASLHLCINTVCHQAEACCMAQAARAAWHGDGPGALAVPAASHRGCPSCVRGTDATLIQSPEHCRMGGEGRGSWGCARL